MGTKLSTITDSVFAFNDNMAVTEIGSIADFHEVHFAFEITEEQIDAMRNGKVLYWDDEYEYAVFIRMKREHKETPEEAYARGYADAVKEAKEKLSEIFGFTEQEG